MLELTVSQRLPDLQLLLVPSLLLGQGETCAPAEDLGYVVGVIAILRLLRLLLQALLKLLVPLSLGVHREREPVH